MKKISLFIIIAGMLSACGKNFLDIQPVDKKTIENFYQTPDDAFAGLVSAYSVLNWDGYGNILLTTEIASDNSHGGGGASDNGLRQWDRSEKIYDHNAAAWTKYYTGIYRANVLLENIERVDFKGNDAQKNMYIAEAKFLRAYYYFDVVRMFGHVPLVTKPLKTGEYYVKQASPDSVYAQIATDLNESIPHLLNKKYSEYTSTEYGRATKWAAEALLARVYLYYTGYYNKPDLAGIVNKSNMLTNLADVINNSGYDLVEKYGNIFRASAASTAEYAGQNSKEGIFNIQYTYKGLKDGNERNGNRVQVMIGIRSQNLLPYYTGWGAATINPKTWNAFEAGDTRKLASAISIAEEGFGNVYSLGDQVQYTGLFQKKYTPLNDKKPEDLGGDFQIDNYDNYLAIRFSDVLLMAAELNLDVNLGTAQTYYDRVRDRAFGDQTHRKTLVAGATGVKLIMDERRFEFVGEGLRYWDLLRQGLNTAKAAIDNTSSDATLNVNFRVETKGLFAIPESQINLSNGTIVQNEGWN
ncbi:SusD-like starch-binding protein associating with outer membrane [Chitinophaga skermanii]|uniref:SusD-like starch-binding protein associating with outer membrane n=1 Tax=Chitinophaga skermanii TaxID=331697 RepID=A0A327Q7I5_9BACT|nr:RagB/SusD family nutrient uptake outer membrane protein [Chitinophaga skermanii]RAI99833.1 SusD-like starch-binding protein associating with outer membrane [Chitinophaga skermanii]